MRIPERTVFVQSVCVALLGSVLAACGGAAPIPTPPPSDRDADGIPDADDLCPEAPETANGYRDDDGCPDDSTAHGTIPPAVIGTWVGRLTLPPGTQPASSLAHTVTIAEAPEGNATLSGVCPDGTGSVTLAWRNDKAAWYGVVICPNVLLGGCVASDLAVYLVSVTTAPDQTLRMTESGSMRSPTTQTPACSANGDMVMVFTGTRQ